MKNELFKRFVLFLVVFWFGCGFNPYIPKISQHELFPPIEVLFENTQKNPLKPWQHCHQLEQDRAGSWFVPVSYTFGKRRDNYVITCGEDALINCFDSSPLQFTLRTDSEVRGNQITESLVLEAPPTRLTTLDAHQHYLRIYFRGTWLPKDTRPTMLHFYLKCKSS